ncbi:hypothetical protein jhhlp_003353 [Lomentospora prolificans]|uniref:polynucleotide adenylyltransferase n=1 Tax=Lomentospora prolificans TaxID=41688 RepID=A0A2N3NGN6_9PEZI|nr:hypothetical protein jhhlp_003353 [Lomentospora prolificans]
MSWSVGHLVILQRDKSHAPFRMRPLKSINLETLEIICAPTHLDWYEDKGPVLEASLDVATPCETYTYCELSNRWNALEPAVTVEEDKGAYGIPEALVIASYNVLAEFTWPPSQARYPRLIRNLLAETAVSDILILEEVTDDFLSYLLADTQIRAQYPFSSHGPPSQEDLGPLPSLLNQVVLSRIPFSWEHLPLKRRHKASAVVIFPSLTAPDGQPLILATCHLSQGMTEGAVTAKLGEMRRITDHLRTKWKDSPWIIAGDFNITTSRITIDAALEKKAVTKQTAMRMISLDEDFRGLGLFDAWVLARLGVGESSDDMRQPKDIWDSFEGEQGATFDPTRNVLASKLMGDGANNRPQRYDRILIRPQDTFTVAGFNMFGFPSKDLSDDGEDIDRSPASDHWGIRCLLRKAGLQTGMQSNTILQMEPVSLKQAPSSLSDLEGLKSLLRRLNGFPTEEDEAIRNGALRTLRSAIMDAFFTRNFRGDAQTHLQPPLVVDPVGSYALGAWSRDSDIDCLCVGPFSSRTFFSVITSHFRKSSDIKVLRKVKANTGLMLELEVGGIRFDLQYCGSTSIAESWPDVLKRPANDPAFALPPQTLLKLKPARDIAYLKRSVPDLAQFRLAYLLIKAWAKESGIYAAKFGYLGGIHIASMLIPVCKLLRLTGAAVSTTDVIASFFNYYADFNWKEKAVFDPGFHKHLKYTRTSREAMCLLGWHPPSLNTALTASVSTARIISQQIKRANILMSDEGMTWPHFLGADVPSGLDQRLVPGRRGAAAFLQDFRTYIRIDAHYWGPSQGKGKQFVGWLESRCVQVLVDIDRRISGLLTRIWPTKFVEPQQGGEENSEYRGSILIGLEWDDHGGSIRTKDELRVAEGALCAVLAQFESRIRADSMYYDGKACWMSARLANRKEIAGLELDTRQWAEYTGGEDDSDSDLDEDSPGLEEGEELSPTWDIQGHHHIATSSDGARRTGKFRTAADVMNRLRWDENMDSADFIVGYEDRFVGIKERPLDEWTGEQTDEEFIPQHRIQYFRRRSDGARVWDRTLRVDSIFGSGKGPRLDD